MQGKFTFAGELLSIVLINVIAFINAFPRPADSELLLKSDIFLRRMVFTVHMLLNAIGCCLHHVISASMGLAPSCVERGATLCWHSRKVALDGGSSLLSLIRITQIVTPPPQLISFVVAVKRNYIVIRLIASTFCLKLSVLEGGNHIMQIFKGLEGMHSKFLSRVDLLIFNTV